MIKIGSIKTINLVEVVEAAGENCWGGNPIWDEMIDHEYGGQTFGNDMIFRYVLPSINGEDLSRVQNRIRNICWEAIEDENIIYFDVSW